MFTSNGISHPTSESLPMNLTSNKNSAMTSEYPHLMPPRSNTTLKACTLQTCSTTRKFRPGKSNAPPTKHGTPPRLISSPSKKARRSSMPNAKHTPVDTRVLTVLSAPTASAPHHLEPSHPLTTKQYLSTQTVSRLLLNTHRNMLLHSLQHKTIASSNSKPQQQETLTQATKFIALLTANQQNPRTRSNTSGYTCTSLPTSWLKHPPFCTHRHGGSCPQHIPLLQVICTTLHKRLCHSNLIRAISLIESMQTIFTHHLHLCHSFLQTQLYY